MVIRMVRFNFYLLLLAVLAMATGCQNTEYKKKRQDAVLRIHMEVARDMPTFSQSTVVGRTSPITVNVERNPFLTEDNVTSAKIVEVTGGFALQIQFDRNGTTLLEQYTALNPRRRLAIYSQFGEKLEHARWLGAPMVYKRISTGSITFTPDANREETAAIELGLNNHARKTQPKAEKQP
jgi:preprotein translocase subunit SecD